MRLGIAITALAIAGLSALPARAGLTPSDVVGNWGTQQNCIGGAFTYASNETGFEQVMRDGARIQKTPIKVIVRRDTVDIQIDEKIYTYRLRDRNRLEILRYTDTRTGLTARLSPRTWYRCS